MVHAGCPIRSDRKTRENRSDRLGQTVANNEGADCPQGGCEGAIVEGENTMIEDQY